MALRNVISALTLGVILGGCANTTPIYLEPTAQAILVEPENNVLLLKSLGGAERQRLRDFIMVASQGRRDALHLEVSGARRLGAQVVRQAMALGVEPANIRRFDGRADPNGVFAVRVEAVAYRAIPPECPSLSIVGPSVNDNSFDQTLGCSNRNNLAAMVNDPRDLIGNGAVTAGNGDRAARPVAAYRAFSRDGVHSAPNATGGVPSPTAPSGGVSAVTTQ